MECKRRTIARENLGFESEIEKAKMERALAKE
jgi:hypothetical protein